MLHFLLITIMLATINYLAQDEKHVMILFNDAQRLGPVFSRLMDQIKGRVRRNLVMLAVWNEEESPTGVPLVGHGRSMLLPPESRKGIAKRLKEILKKRIRVPERDLERLAAHIEKGVD